MLHQFIQVYHKSKLYDNFPSKQVGLDLEKHNQI
jgi:hypothetical protein